MPACYAGADSVQVNVQAHRDYMIAARSPKSRAIRVGSAWAMTSLAGKCLPGGAGVECTGSAADAGERKSRKTKWRQLPDHSVDDM